MSLQYEAAHHVLETSVNHATSYAQLNEVRFGRLGAKVFQLPIYFGFPLRIPFVFMVPAPWVHQGGIQAFLGLGTIGQFFMLPFLVLGLRMSCVDGRYKLFFTTMLLGVASSSMTLRHFTAFIPFAFMVGAAPYSRSVQYREFSWYPRYLGFVAGVIGAAGAIIVVI